MTFNDNEIIIALIAFIGVMVGTIITSIVNIFVTKKETKLRVLEKVFDKRIQAYENILFLVKLIRTVNPTNKANERGYLLTYPISLNSKNSFSEFKDDLLIGIDKNLHWLNIELVRELYLLQDYFVNLDILVNDLEEEKIIELGLIIKQDFIHFAMNIENLAFDFFRKDIYNLKINKNKEWHKYEKTESRKRLQNTLLFSKKNEIEKLYAK
jgi:hypothetical protein